MRLRRGGTAAVWMLIASGVLAACQRTPTSTQLIPATVSAPALSSPTPQALPTSIPSDGTATPPGPVAGTVIADQTLSLDSAHPVTQVVLFEASEGLVIRVQATRQSSELDYQLTLIDKYGTSLAHIESALGSISEIISEITLPHAGEYRLSITPSTGSGSLHLSAMVLETASGGGDFEILPVDSTGNMAALGIYHIYKFPLSDGDTVSITAEDQNSNPIELSLALIGPDGRKIDPAPVGSALHGFIAPMGGTYLAIVSNPQGGGGTYQFRVTSDVAISPPDGPADIGYDQVYRANFADQSVLSATFDGTTGDILSISVDEPDPDLKIDIYLYSPYDHIIAFAANGRAGGNVILQEAQLPYSGRYRLELRPHGSGVASFSISRLPLESLSGGGAFGNEDSAARSGRFGSQNVFHYYQFEGTPGQTVNLSFVMPEDSELQLGVALLSPAGQEITFVELGDLDGQLIRLDNVSLRQRGTFTIIVYPLRNTQGIYEIRFERAQ